VTSQITIPLITALLAVFWFVVAAAVRRRSLRTFKLALAGGSLAVVMLAALILIIALEEPITAPVAVPLFVATILQFGFIIALASQTISGRLSQRTFLVGVLVIIATIVVGVVLMFQPLTPTVFNLGFDLVLIALLAFNVWSHITPRSEGHR